MKIAMFGKMFDEEYDGLLKDIINILRDNGVGVTMYEPLWKAIAPRWGSYECEIYSDYKELAECADMLFSFGGDGTILDSLPLVRDSGIPVFGINTGHLGFLSSVSVTEALTAVQGIISGNFDIERRSMIQLEAPAGIYDEINYALNEATILRKDNGSLIMITVYVNDCLLTTFWADGLILATPTGSTAYSLSVGGPIIVPDTNNFLITPIAAHNLTVRPIVISDKSTVRIKVDGRCDSFALGLDSRVRLLENTVELKFSKTDFCFNTVKMKGKDFFNAIRNKLLWGSDVRN